MSHDTQSGRSGLGEQTKRAASFVSSLAKRKGGAEVIAFQKQRWGKPWVPLS